MIAHKALSMRRRKGDRRTIIVLKITRDMQGLIWGEHDLGTVALGMCLYYDCIHEMVITII